MSLLTREQFLSADDRKYETVSLKKLGGDVRIRTMSGKEQLMMEDFRQKNENSDWIYWMIVTCCVDENNQKMFTEDDIKSIEEKSSSTVTALVKAIVELNSITQEKLEEEAKN